MRYGGTNNDRSAICWDVVLGRRRAPRIPSGKWKKSMPTVWGLTLKLQGFNIFKLHQQSFKNMVDAIGVVLWQSITIKKFILKGDLSEKIELYAQDVKSMESQCYNQI